MRKKVKRGMLFLITILFLIFLEGCTSGRSEPNLADIVNQPPELNIILPDGTVKVIAWDAPEVLNKGGEMEITQLLGLAKEMPAMIYSNQGEVISGTTKGQIGTAQNGFYYYDGLSSGDKGEKVTGVIGMMISPPPGRITEVAEETKKLLAAGGRVLILYIDGFGYLQFEEGKERGIIPNMENWGELKKGVTVFPSITPVAYGALITGKNPKETGIRKRGDGPLKASTIFHWAKEMGKDTLVLEGNQQFFDLPGEIIFHQDLNDDHLVDDEIYHTAQEKLKTGCYDLVLVHFHSIDDVSHTFGPGASATWQQVQAIDQYIGDLLNIWQGQVIITADHGQHDVQEEGRMGDHGDFIPQDMFIPIITGEVK